MSPALALFTFISSWWIAFMIAIPFGTEEGKKDAIAYQAAPARFNWKKSVAIATVISVIFTILMAIIINSDLIPMDTL